MTNKKTEQKNYSHNITTQKFDFIFLDVLLTLNTNNTIILSHVWH
jgi:hypothetical protein